MDLNMVIHRPEKSNGFTLGQTQFYPPQAQ